MKFGIDVLHYWHDSLQNIERGQISVEQRGGREVLTFGFPSEYLLDQAKEWPETGLLCIHDGQPHRARKCVRFADIKLMLRGLGHIE